MTEQSYDELTRTLFELGRSVATRYSRPFQVDGRPITCVEMQALLYWSRRDGDALVDRLVSFLSAWGIDYDNHGNLTAQRQEAGRAAVGADSEA